MPLRFTLFVILNILLLASAQAQVGDPQLGTDHPWYPGELAMSTFERLFATQAEQYERTTGIHPRSDHDRAMASWLFRNTHFAHGEDGKENLWGKGFSNDVHSATRDYWTGLFAHGYGLCGTTHAQWTAELDVLLGSCRSRVVGTQGHNSFEVFLTGGPYEAGRWAMLDHDLSTVIANEAGDALLGLDAISKGWQKLAKREYLPARQNGWLVCGLHPDDGAAYAAYTSAEYRAGYAGPQPIIYLRKGEKLRRYFEPGLTSDTKDGRTFVFWGRNYMTGNIPGPERSRTWVNQPEKMFQSKTGTAHIDGQVRYGNAVYSWRPDFEGGTYKEGASDEGDSHVTLEFYTPYIIGATPASDGPWGIYDAGGKNGLVLQGTAACQVSISTDGGTTWHPCGNFRDAMDLTDFVKGHRQWHLRFGAGASQLIDSKLSITTVCQLNSATLPRLKDDGTKIRYEASGQAMVKFGPNIQQITPHVVDGALDSSRLTLELKTPRGESIREFHVAAHVASSNPPDPSVNYQMEYMLGGAGSWKSLDKGSIQRRGIEPKDFWSQSMWSGHGIVQESDVSSMQVRFRNDGGKRYMRAEGHLVYGVPNKPVRVTYAWTDSTGSHEEGMRMDGSDSWQLVTHKDVKTRWVEISAE
ncbi:MAG: hypothetical protein ABL921_09160 [Pirellula sp.]